MSKGINAYGIFEASEKEESLREIIEIPKKKKPKFNFKNLISAPKRKAWDWDEQEGMFGKGIFE